MPVFDPTTPMQTRRLAGSPYGYSGTRLDALGASEYTLVAIAADQSGSVNAFRTEIERCLAEIVRACAAHARADQVVLRVVAFDDRLHEVHGFTPIPALDPANYAGCLRIGGSTALHDAAINAVASVASYGDALSGADFAVNGLVFVLTDGEDNASAGSAREVAAAVKAAVSSERLDGVRTVLVGVGVGGATSATLMRLSAEAGFDDYVAIETADAASLQRLARFASRSIALQSTALGAGTSSTVKLTF
jgi:uncharacterized protein YegL